VGLRAHPKILSGGLGLIGKAKEQLLNTLGILGSGLGCNQGVGTNRADTAAIAVVSACCGRAVNTPPAWLASAVADTTIVDALTLIA